MRPTRHSRNSALTIATTAVLACAALAACNKTEAPQQLTATAKQANDRFAAITAACTQFLAAREAHVGPISASEAKDSNTWAKTGYSPALVQPEVNATESPVTPFVGKIVIKDNEARATAATEAEAKAIALTPAHLLSNRTHTLVYSFDGTQWRWQNGQRLTKAPGQNDAMAALTLAEVSAPGPKGFAGCLPS
jgi:hypothetical protein